jgi:hypothetical protein
MRKVRASPFKIAFVQRRTPLAPSVESLDLVPVRWVHQSLLAGPSPKHRAETHLQHRLLRLWKSLRLLLLPLAMRRLLAGRDQSLMNFRGFTSEGRAHGTAQEMAREKAPKEAIPTLLNAGLVRPRSSRLFRPSQSPHAAKKMRLTT